MPNFATAATVPPRAVHPLEFAEAFVRDAIPYAPTGSRVAEIVARPELPAGRGQIAVGQSMVAVV